MGRLLLAIAALFILLKIILGWSVIISTILTIIGAFIFLNIWWVAVVMDRGPGSGKLAYRLLVVEGMTKAQAAARMKELGLPPQGIKMEFEQAELLAQRQQERH